MCIIDALAGTPLQAQPVPFCGRLVSTAFVVAPYRLWFFIARCLHRCQALCILVLRLVGVFIRWGVEAVKVIDHNAEAIPRIKTQHLNKTIMPNRLLLLLLVSLGSSRFPANERPNIVFGTSQPTTH